MQKGAAVHFILVSYRRLDNPSGSIRGLERSNLRNTPKCHYDMWRGVAHTHTHTGCEISPLLHSYALSL
jgi:hypothetical protein